MMISCPSDSLEHYPDEDGYSVRCSQVLLSLVSLEKVRNVFSIELISPHHLHPTEYPRNNPSRKYLKLAYRTPWRIAPSRVMTWASFARLSFKLITRRKYWNWFSHSRLLLVENVNMLSPLFLVTSSIARITNKTVIVDFHDVFSIGKHESRALTFLSKALEFIYSKFANVFIFVGGEERKYYVESFHVTKPARVIPTAIMFDFHAHAIEEPANLPLRPSRIILFLGNLGTPSNSFAVDYILNVLSPSFRDKDVLFVCAGPSFERWTRSLGGVINGNVIFTGLLDRQSLDSLIRSATLCIAPLSYSTGLKTKVLDYCSHRKPAVISTQASLNLPIDSLPSVIVSDLDRFSESLSYALSHVDELLTKTEASAAYVQTEFSFERFKSELQSLIESN